MLKNFVAVYVPSTSGLADPVTPSEHNARALLVATELSAAFGGATLFPTIGTYLADSGTLVTENIIIVKSFHDADPDEAEKTIATIAAAVKLEYAQESVAYETQDGINFC
jgi:hypothetical protein